MTNRKIHRPLAAMVALLGLASFAVIACGDDDDATNNGTNTGTDSGAKADTGSSDETDAGIDASSEEYTVDIGAGFATVCALSNKGHVKCWGDAVDGEMLSAPQQGKQCYSVDDTALTDCDARGPTALAIPGTVEQLSVSYLNVCVITNDGGTRKLGCWGDPAETSRLSSYGPDSGIATSIVWIPLPAEPKRIVGDQYFKLVELTDGTIYGWGDNKYGHWAGPVQTTIATPTKVWPVADAGGADAGALIDIATEKYSSFALTAGGLYGTGDNSEFQQQLGPAVDEIHAWTKLPSARNGSDAGAFPDAGGDPIVKLFKSNSRALGACYITASGKAYCWGNNDYGQTGALVNENVAPVQTPTQIDLPAGRTATQIAIATGGICAITDDGAVYCWGDNTRGAAGQEPPQGSLASPRLVPGITGAQAIAVGTVYFACALTADHKTHCWGDNGYGQRGNTPDGGASQYSSTPSEVPLTW